MLSLLRGFLLSPSSSLFTLHFKSAFSLQRSFDDFEITNSLSRRRSRGNKACWCLDNSLTPHSAKCGAMLLMRKPHIGPPKSVTIAEYRIEWVHFKSAFSFQRSFGDFEIINSLSRRRSRGNKAWWCLDNSLTPHSAKCGAMLLMRKPHIGQPKSVTIGEDRIEWVKHTRILGVTIDDLLSWSHHLTDVKKNFINPFRTARVVAPHMERCIHSSLDPFSF